MDRPEFRNGSEYQLTKFDQRCTVTSIGTNADGRGCLGAGSSGVGTAPSGPPSGSLP